MVYSVWLFGLSLLFIIAERLRPRRPQRLLRRGIWSDIAYLVFNGEYLGVLVGVLFIPLAGKFDLAVMQGQPFWLQFIVLLLSFDFLQWCIHNLLHRVPVLWRFHKVHHSIVEMDWIGNWRFHWFEVVFYRSLLYIPAAILGFSAPAMFWYGVVNTFAGHFAHSNLAGSVGPLKYVVNSPEMHLWHHNHPDSGPVNRNFGITLSVWDWLFGTAHVPAHDPQSLGFEGIERYPKQLPGQWLAPFWRR